MPKKGYKQTIEHRKNSSKAHTGKIGKDSSNYKGGITLKIYYCKDCGEKISYASALYKGGKCKVCSQTGKKYSKATRQKIREAGLGRKLTILTKRKIKQSHIGLKHTKVSKRKQSLSHGGTGIPYELTEYGAEFDNALKEQVRFRDGYKCQVCGCSQLENGKQLDVHHKDYNKKNNILNNLIALCHSCHMKTNNNRISWKEYFYVFIA